tara:strand:+ start:245 stop:472 length:228 start_codon:yes stop_codon:yes gene_type:complete
MNEKNKFVRITDKVVRNAHKILSFNSVNNLLKININKKRNPQNQIMPIRKKLFFESTIEDFLTFFEVEIIISFFN